MLDRPNDLLDGPWTCWRCRGKGVVLRLAWPFGRKCPECDGFGHRYRRFAAAPVRSNKETQ
jgi:DnaJ-class molecular chaperone